MYLPYIMTGLIYLLRAIMRNMFPANLKLRQFLVFLLGMYAFILLCGCASGYARWLGFQRSAQKTEAQIIFTGACTDNMYIQGRHMRAYKQIIIVPEERFDPAYQPFADDTSGGSLVYRLQNSHIDSVLAATQVQAGSLKRLNAAATPKLEYKGQGAGLPATTAQAAVAVAATEAALDSAVAVREASVPQPADNNGFRCIGYRFQLPQTREWVYAQEPTSGLQARDWQASTVTVLYQPDYLENNWLEAGIPITMQSSIHYAWFYLGVLAETLISGYLMGIRRKGTPGGKALQRKP